MQTESITKVTNCKHCQQQIPSGAHYGEFCCNGCSLVFKILNDNNLLEYYRLREQDQAQGVPAASADQTDFAYFNDPQFLTKNSRNVNGDIFEIRFLLQGVHCLACIWLLEKLPELCLGVVSSRIDFSSSVIIVRYDQTKTSAAQIAQTINNLGYYPLELTRSNQSITLNREIRSFLYRIGVAGVCAGNIMMIAVSLYQAGAAGIEPEFHLFLRAISFLLAIPVLTYAAWPFYSAAWNGIKVGVLHIDLPISVGIILGFLLSTYNFLRGSGEVYFDSLSVLVLLMLFGRLLQRYSLSKALRSAESSRFLEDYAFRIEGQVIKRVYYAALKSGDIVFVPKGSRVPVDGVITAGFSQLDLSVLTGESYPLAVSPGTLVLAGSANLGADLQISAQSSFAESRFGGLINNLEMQSTGNKKTSLSITDRISSIFVPLVTITAIVNFSYWLSNSGINQAIETTLALLVITCPCAVGLAAPLTLVSAISQAMRKGIYIKAPSAFELLSRAKTFIFDKTGTITYGNFTLHEVILYDSSIDRSFSNSIVAAIESCSQHPIARSLVPQILENPDSAHKCLDFKEISGVGVWGNVQQKEYFFGSSAATISQGTEVSSVHLAKIQELALKGLTVCCLVHANKLLAIYALGDLLRTEFFKFANDLKRSQHEIIIASGDETVIVQSVGKQIGVETDNCYGNYSPEDKASLVEKIKSKDGNNIVVMVGDGVNDLAALQAADLGIGVSGGIVRCLQSADIFLSRYNVHDLDALISGSARVVRRIKLIIGLSIAYNIAGAILSICGAASPLVAALLMPISSLTVISLASTLTVFKKGVKWA